MSAVDPYPSIHRYTAESLPSPPPASPRSDVGLVWMEDDDKEKARNMHIEASTEGDRRDDQKDLAIATLVAGLQAFRNPSVNIEADSTDGAFILMPQVARSANWHKDALVLLFSSYFFHMLHFFLAVNLLAYISKEEMVMDLFGGEMYLCDFGRHQDCIDKTDSRCIGPAGTQITPPRLYSFHDWSTRSFVRDSLKALLPDRSNNIDELVDPGEYGLESYACRLLCTSLFVLSISTEMFTCWELVRLLWYLPSKNESWISFDPDVVHDADWTERLKVKVAGMSVAWKVWNVAFVVLPKTALVFLAARAGVVFLMETPDIDGIVLNTVALNFILGIDSLVMNALMSKQAHQLLGMCEGMTIQRKKPSKFNGDDSLQMQHPLPSGGERTLIQRRQSFIWHGDVAIGTETDLIRNARETRGTWMSVFADLFTRKLLTVYVVASFTFGLVFNYYTTHCDWRDGRWISKEMHLPLSTYLTWGNAFLPNLFPIPSEPKAFWEYSE